MSFRTSARSVAGTQLASVDAVAFDTETTGLDIRTARIIEIAGIRVGTHHTGPALTHSSLINPGCAIPGSSTEIHGITDDMVADAPPFRDTISGFADWCGPALLLGYSLDFDLAILEAEHRRCGLLWSPPQTLDVQELAQALRPDIRNWTMESVADWLSVTTGGRHRALADAELTAELYRALVPRLQEAGITTVAEAMRVCQSLRQESIPVRRATGKRSETSGFHSFPYRRRVREVMSQPAAIVDRNISLRTAVDTMVERGITSLFVSGFAGREHGILTESDIMRAISGKDASALDEPVGKHCSRPLRTITEKEFVYRAIVAMTSGGIRHLGVIDGDGRLVGAVTAKDSFDSHGADAVSLGANIEAASSPAELGRIWSDLGSIAESLLNSSVEPRKIAAIISRELRAMTAKSCDIALSETASRLGTPPAPFAVLVLGSGGRGESLLAMDQDNAIVIGGDSGSRCRMVHRVRKGDDLDPE